MLIRWFKTILLITILLAIVFNKHVLAQEDKQEPPKTPAIKLMLSSKEGIYRNNNPIMLSLVFRNTSTETYKLCLYKFDEGLINFDIKSGANKKIDFEPKLIQADKIKPKDWVEIPPRRSYRKMISLTRQIIELIGVPLDTGNYSIKAVYDSCNKFDSSIPEEKFESNSINIMVIE